MQESFSETVLSRAVCDIGTASIVESTHVPGAVIDYVRPDPFLRLHLAPDAMDWKLLHPRPFNDQRPARMMFFAADAGTSSIVGTRRLKSLHLSLPKDDLETLLGPTASQPLMQRDLPVAIDQVEMIAAMQRIYGEMIRDRPLTQIMIESQILMIAASLARILGSDSDDNAADGACLPRSRIDAVEDFVRNCRTVPTLADIAGHVGLSIGHLRSSYRAATGRTLYQFIQIIRIQRARELLQQCRMPLKAVAFELGYGSISSFLTAFRRQTGETPGAFMRKCDRRTN